MSPGHPRTPPRKTMPSTPGGVIALNSTLERYDSPSVASPEKALLTQKTAPLLANEESTVESQVEQVSGSTSNGAKPKPCGADTGDATNDCVRDSADTPDSAARGHGQATSPEVKLVFAIFPEKIGFKLLFFQRFWTCYGHVLDLMNFV